MCSSRPGVRAMQRRPFRLGLLHAVFAEHPLAGGDDRLDGVRVKGLRHRHQGHARRIARCLAAGASRSPAATAQGRPAGAGAASRAMHNTAPLADTKPATDRWRKRCGQAAFFHCADVLLDLLRWTCWSTGHPIRRDQMMCRRPWDPSSSSLIWLEPSSDPRFRRAGRRNPGLPCVP